MSSYSIITPTGFRPFAFSLCSLFVQRQTVLPNEWIVVDDGDTPVEVPQCSYIKYIRRMRKKSDTDKTLPAQMREALRHVTTDYVLIMEDDDWYAPSFCEKQLSLFTMGNLIGRSWNIYYHITAAKMFFLQCGNRCGWCQTGFHSCLIEDILKLCYDQNPFLDLRVWRMNVKKSICKQEEEVLYISTKGLGTRALGMGQDANHKFYFPDMDGKWLKSTIGQDVDLYKSIGKT